MPVDYKAILRIMDRAEPGLEMAFLRAVRETQDATVQGEVEAALRRHDVNAAVDAVPWSDVGGRVMRAAFMSRFADVFRESGNFAARVVPGVEPFDFAITDPRPLRYLEQHGARLVKEIDDSTKAALRATVARNLDMGLPLQQQTANILQHVGLLERHSRAVNSFYKQQVDNGMEPGKAQRLADKMSARLLRWRGRNIARTETAMAATAGQREAWQQAVDEELVDPDTAVIEWVTTPDDLTCDECAAMNGETIGIGEQFEGGIDGPALHPGCRCVLTMSTRGPRRRIA